MKRKPTCLAIIACGVSLFLAPGCSSTNSGDDGQSSVLKLAWSELKSPLQHRPAVEAKPKATDIDAIVKEAMRLNSGPLILVNRDGQPPTILGEIGRNGAGRTYATPDMQSITLLNGIVVATRGMGDDVISADVHSVASAISSRADSAEVPRTVRFLDGLGTERPLPLTCSISRSKAATTRSGSLMVERCTGQGFDLSNRYQVGSDGVVTSSRQWISPQIGYLTFQTLRE